MRLDSWDGAWYTGHNGNTFVTISQILMEWSGFFVHQNNVWHSLQIFQLTPNIVRTLSQHCIWLGQIQHCYSVAKILMKKVYITMLIQHCHNIGLTLRQHYIILQYCHNVGTTLKKMLYHNTKIVGQCRWNTATKFVQVHNFQCCHDMKQCCLNVMDPTRVQCCLTCELCHFKFYYNIATILQEHTENQ